MLGAIIGDIVGSRFEFSNIKTKNFELFTNESDFTDDTVLTVAVSDALLENTGDLRATTKKKLVEYGKKYPGRGYGSMFSFWLNSLYKEPYNSYGNGAAMRISPVSMYASTFDEVISFSKNVTEVTHDHPEGLRGAEAVAMAGFLAKSQHSKQEIRNYIERYYYPLNFRISEIKKTYKFNETCQETVPQAIECFLESESFDDCLRLSISLGGDSDTLTAISCGIAELYYGLNLSDYSRIFDILDENLIEKTKKFYAYFGKSLKV